MGLQRYSVIEREDLPTTMEKSKYGGWVDAGEATALIEQLKVQIRDAFRSGYWSGHHDTVEGKFRSCYQGSTERADEWYEDEFGEPCKESFSVESR